MSEKPERQRIVEEAIEWMVRLQSGDFSAAEGDALERWKALSSEHAEVFRQLLGSLLLAEERGAIRLVTLRGSARLTTGEGRQLVVAARRSLLFDAGGLLEQGPMQAGEDAWASGWLEVHDRSLAWVAEAFRPYLPGILQLDAEIAGNRVSGLFPLDDMHTSLDMLGRSLPIRVLRYSDYWISLRPA
ncbi:TPA: DUF4880 domain-containing protein [Pseudomonas aeruginosa]|nr:DUF4880 domain-containing protein [Pseudomonas aeruginosa]